MSKLLLPGILSQAVDPARALTNEYKAYAIANGFTIINESAIYTMYASLILSGEINKRCYLFGHNYAVKKDINNKVEALLSLVKSGGQYIQATNTILASRPTWTEDYITFDLANTFLSFNGITFNKDSFYTEVEGTINYKSTSNSILLFGNMSLRVISLNRQYNATLPELLSSTTGSNYFDNNINTYKTTATRSGDNVIMRTYKNSALFHTATSRVWSYNIGSDFINQIIGGVAINMKMKTLKIGEL